MAAIMPRLEQPYDEDIDQLEDSGYLCASEDAASGVAGLGQTTCPAPQAVLEQAHIGLMNMAWVRQATEEQLRGRTFHVVQEDGSIYIELDEPVGHGAPWNPIASPTGKRYSMLSWTSKMAAPSFSIPAGALETGGSCPGAAAGQSIVPIEKLRASAALVERVTGEPVRLHEAICDHCYATGGQYSTGGVQVAQLLRYMWCRAALKDGTFVDVMHAAIEGADYLTDGGTANGVRLPPDRGGERFFRIHDSGDFFSRAYLEAWCEVISRSPDIHFWAPTRIWATSWGIEAVNALAESGRMPPNLALRPSAYHVGQAAPHPDRIGPGWSAGSTVIHAKANLGMTPEREEMARRGGAVLRPAHRPWVGRNDPRYDWNCQTYAIDDKAWAREQRAAGTKEKVQHTCRIAAAPDGERGCRACWVVTDDVINYTLH